MNKFILTTTAFVGVTTLASAANLTGEIFNGWEGDVEAGATYSTGNTEKETFNAGIKLNKDGETSSWGHTVKATAYTSKDNDTQNAEEYRVSGQSRYNISDTDYAFGEAEYVNDRFSGFNYRVSEGVGYGRKFHNTPELSIVGEVSVGGQHTEDTAGQKENSALGKLSGKVDWKINENVSFTEDLSISFANSTITRSETAIKSALSESLYLKIGVDIEHNSEVPVGKESTDTLTSISLGYNF